MVTDQWSVKDELCHIVQVDKVFEREILLISRFGTHKSVAFY